MSKISCDTILDLIPLVRDNVASESSKKLVEEHIETCDSCKELYNSLERFETEETIMDDKKIVTKIKKQLFITLMIIVVIASIVGLALSDTFGLFYNILIMPAIGIVGYFALEKKAYLVPISLFVFSYVWLLVKYIADGMFSDIAFGSAIVLPAYWAGIYAALCVVGIIIGFLLKYAFGEESIYEN